MKSFFSIEITETSNLNSNLTEIPETTARARKRVSLHVHFEVADSENKRDLI